MLGGGGCWPWEPPICLRLFGAEGGLGHMGQLDVVSFQLFLAVVQPHQASVSTSQSWGEYNYIYFNTFIRKAKGHNEVKVLAIVELLRNIQKYPTSFPVSLMLLALIRAPTCESLTIISTFPNIYWVPAVGQALYYAFYMYYLT